MKKRIFSIFTAFALLFTTLPVNALAVGNADAGGLCEHHPSHTAECGYAEGAEGTPCNHEHTEDCYTLVEKCVHEHTEDCYPAEGVSDNTATPSDAEDREPTECTHVCSEDTGCIKEKLDCQHEHDDDCGYAPATESTPCGFVCEKCNAEPGEQEKDECICDAPCTEEIINTDCPMCSAEDADLTLCKGKPAQAQQITITSFEELPEEVREQFVPAGTKLADLNLPDTLGASGYVGTQDSGGAEPLTIEGVTWESDPTYDENVEQGAWLFTAKLPEGYTLLEGVELPQIGVMAEPVNLLEEVTAPGGWITADSTAEEIKSYFGNAATVDSSTKTITLAEGAVITLSASIRFCNCEWKLNLNGATLKKMGETSVITLYILNGTLTITGSGTVEGASADRVGGTGIDVSDGALCIAEGVTLTAIGGNSSKTGKEAIYVTSGTVTGPGTIHATGGSGGDCGGDGIRIYNGIVSCGNLTAVGGPGTDIGGAGVSMHYSSSLIVAETLMASGGANDTDGTKKDISVNPYNYGGSSTISAGELVGSIDTGSDICSVTFDANNGTTGSLLQFVKKGGKVEAPEAPTNGGRTFLGWYNGDAPLDFDNDPVTESMTLTAKWIEPIPYLTCDENGQNWETAYRATYTIVNGNAWKDGWYVIDKGPVYFHDRIVVQGDVHLILKDSVSVRAAEGIQVSKGSSLTIYAQSTGDDMGSLTAATTKDNFAGIGGGYINTSGLSIGEDGGNITIYGGSINATGGKFGAGIGGGSGDGGTTTIYGGIINAAGGTSAAGIGGGYWGSSGTVIIRGGNVTATGSDYGAGIGTGCDGSGGKITISGGTVDAKSGDSSVAAAIGDTDVTIDISGGTVTATHANANNNNGTGAGIRGTVKISGGFVTATGGRSYNSAGGIDGNFSTTTQGNAVIVTDKITGQVDESSLSGIIIVGWEGQLYGQNVTPTDDFTIPRNKELTILEGSTLTIKDGITAINEGTIYKYGAIDGTITNGNDGTILEKSSITVSVSGSSSGDSIPEALYGDSFYVNAVVGKADKNRAAYEGSVTFYVEMDGKKISLGLANVQNGKAWQYVNMTGGQWKDKWWKPGDYTITAEFQNSDTLMKNNGQTVLKIKCDHTHNTNTTNDCTASVQCSICQQTIAAAQNSHNFGTWSLSMGGGTHRGEDCTNTTCTGGVCTKIVIEDCSGGTATCTKRARCDKCGAEYGVFAKHRMTTYAAAQAADCTSAGNVEYWSCDVCGKNFADADGKMELQDVTIPELGHDWDAWKANNNGTHSRLCKRNNNHTETDSCYFGADDKCTICGGDKPVVAYTVTFDSQGGSSVSSQTIVSGGKVSEPTTPTRTGYTFEGWYNGSTKWDFAKDIVTGDLTMTAHWTADTPTPAEKYSVTVQTNENGTAYASPSSAEVGVTITLTAAPNSGYRFKEWQVVSGNVTISGNSFHMPANDVTIQAIFEKDSSSGSGGSSGGGNSGGSSSGGNSGGGSMIIDRPNEKHPDIPTTSETKPVKPDKDGNISIGGDSIQDAINKATTDANKNGNKDKGIAVTVPVNNASDTKTLTITIPAATLDKLVAAKVRRFDITTNGLPSFSFTLDTLEMLDKQSLGGDLILRLTKTTVTSKQAKEAIGTRPVYDITLVFVKDGKETLFTDWQGMTVSVKLPYTPAQGI